MDKSILVKLLFCISAIYSGIPVFSQGSLRSQQDSLYITYSGKADSVFFKIKNGPRLPLAHGSDHWQTVIGIQGLDAALLQYQFEVYQKGTKISDGQYAVWTGKKRTLHQKVPAIKGRLFIERIQSKSLNEERKLTIYLPPDYDSLQKEKYPVIYLADGDATDGYVPYIEYLIKKKKIPALVLIGVHTGESPFTSLENYNPAKDKRALEYLENLGKYLKGADTLRFTNHLQFFCKEVVAFAESKFNISDNRNGRILFGTSNGSSFTVSAGKYYPEIFGRIISFSFGWDPALSAPEWNSDMYPEYFILAGTLEKKYHSNSTAWYKMLTEKKFKAHFTEVVAYHDDIMWREELLNLLPLVMKAKN
jgi:enterochelin esterase-like enzyme